MRRSSTDETPYRRSPSLDSKLGSPPQRYSGEYEYHSTPFVFGLRTPGSKKAQASYTTAQGRKYVVFYLDLSFIFLLELRRCRMAEGCVRALRYAMVFFNLLFWFFILLLLLLLLEILFIILFFAYQDQIDLYAQSDLKKGLQLFGTEGNIGLTNAWSIVQTDFRCCGVNNHTDWFHVYNATRVPDSCCLEYSDNCGLENPGTWWTAPCYERVKGWLHENLVALWIFALCLALTQILGLVFSMTMFCHAVKVDTFYA
ncbi:tetraspanin 4 variant 1 [Triplophysa rosa]|uniref:Tetraspanin-4 n=1 Tax=Triplophysa rosa TaxID=992332 RepID=A0A9W7TRG0_TRIRA|nr:tetraspanin 4 variant 1 [Triplophysa rosa]